MKIKSDTLYMRLTPDSKKWISEQAEARGMTMTAVVSVAVEKFREDLTTAEFVNPKGVKHYRRKAITK